MSNVLKVGDVFKCKRRGHEIIVAAISVGSLEWRVFYRNIRGSMVSISHRRLLDKTRFEPMPVAALKSETLETVPA